MNVQDLMTRNVQTCRAQDMLNEAARAMWDGDFGCLPVVDADARVLGMITDRDVCMAAYTQGQTLASIAVAKAMSAPVVTCAPQDDLTVAERAMQKNRLRRLPVVDARGRLVGILSLNDIARQAVAERSQKSPAVTANEVAMTLAAACEPRVPKATREAPPAKPSRGTGLLAAGKSDPEC